LITETVGFAVGFTLMLREPALTDRYAVLFG
jgi:hypothetical protein